MKKIFLSLVFLLFTFVCFNTTQAQVFVPEYLDLSINSAALPTFNAGEGVDVKITLSNSDLPGDKTTIEYGVVRQIIKGNTTEYEPISVSGTEKAYAVSGSKIVKINVPNVLDTNSTSTYVFYAKIQVSDDVDKENFIVSKQNFKIKANNEPITKIKYINILQSNGERFALMHGPTIYDLSKTTYKGVASSTSLEITFESNTDTTLVPNIIFNKLRSDSLVQDFKPENIIIKKGLNKVVISLPDFDYNAGVYHGILKTNNKNIPDIDFQYIVGGEMVTFAQPEYSIVDNSQKLVFNIYGTPMDFDLDPILNNISTTTIEKMFSESSLAYNTEFVLKNKGGKELYKTIDNVDFSTSTYSLSIPSNIKDVTQVLIRSVNKNGKVVYEGTKDLNNFQQSKSNTLTLVVLLILLILTIIMSIVLKQKYLKIIVLIIALVVLFLGFKIVTAAVWNVPDSFIVSESYNGDANYYKQLTVNHAGSLIRFNTNIQSEAYDINSGLSLTYKSSFESCNNYPTRAMTSLALYKGSVLKASSSITNVVSAYEYFGGSNWAEAISYQNHNNTYTSNWITVNFGNPEVGDSVAAFHNVTGAYGFTNGKNATVKYSIPLLNVTDKTTTDKCISGKINHVTTIGSAPYNIKVISIVPTSEDCSGDDTATTTPPSDDPTTDEPSVPTDGVCLSSEVQNGKTLKDDSKNLCTTELIKDTFNFIPPSTINLYPSWNWSCKDKTGSGEKMCSSKCSTGLIYCASTQTCSNSCDDGDRCATPGVQKDDDPIYMYTKCLNPETKVSVQFKKPYANDLTSKCSIAWTTTVTPSSVLPSYTTCKLDGVSVDTNSSDYFVSVGQHSLICETKITGADIDENPNAFITSGPITKNFKCSRVPVSSEK